MQGYPPNQPPGGGNPPPPPGPPYGYGAPPGTPPPGGGFGAPGYGPGAALVNPNAPYGIEPTTGLPYSDKQKVVAGLLQIFVGGFGVGRFYTGHTGIAIAQIAVTFLTCGIGALWPLVDGILMLMGKVTDAQGRPLRDG